MCFWNKNMDGPNGDFAAHSLNDNYRQDWQARGHHKRRQQCGSKSPKKKKRLWASCLTCSASLPPSSGCSTLVISPFPNTAPNPLHTVLMRLSIKLLWIRGVCYQVTHQAIHALFFREFESWAQEHRVENVSWSSLKGPPINSCYLDSSGPQIPLLSVGGQIRFYIFCELSNIIPIRSFKVSFCCWQPENPVLYRKVPRKCGMWADTSTWKGYGTYSRWGGQYQQSPQELCFAWFKRRLQGRKYEKSGGRFGVGLVWESPFLLAFFLQQRFPRCCWTHCWAIVSESCRWKERQPAELDCTY